jgi:glutaredoxin
MKKKPIYNYFTGMIIITSILLSASLFKTDASDKIPDIIIYGNEKCGYCRETVKWLEEQKIAFIYRDVELYGAFQEEMFNKLLRAGFTTTAYFPVLDVKGQILMRPKFDDIRKALSGEIIGAGNAMKNRDPLWRPVKKKSLTADFASIKPKLKESDILFYDDGSGSGNNLLKQLKKEKIPFTHKQLNRLSNAAYFDMSSRLASLGYGNITHFPVIEVRGEMIMKPSLDDLKILVIEMLAE